jgi:hypothetical protein
MTKAFSPVVEWKQFTAALPRREKLSDGQLSAAGSRPMASPDVDESSRPFTIPEVASAATDGD